MTCRAQTFITGEQHGDNDYKSVGQLPEKQDVRVSVPLKMMLYRRLTYRNLPWL